MAREYGLSIIPNAQSLTPNAYSAIVLAVSHSQFAELNESDLKALCADPCVIYDIKNVLPRDLVDARL